MRRSAGGRKYGSGYPLPMLATKVISLILYTTRKMDFANRRKNIYILALEYNLKKCYTYT